ncbi:MAG: tRNA (adenosine(37)-N6)-dimethylallyltransferase MiaA [Planctomycetes bacterium]|nr:tRNA (adenosine(37)-N6)-dimethylallyltransferase MiaA [Planctomycetota bacterium]
MTLQPLRILLGPTASGKESLALHLAETTSAEIISVDSMKIYQGMDIGTATPDPETLAKVRHWCINIVDPRQGFSVAQYVDAAEEALREIEAAGKEHLLSGGTALYYKGLTEGLFDGPGAEQPLRDEFRAYAEEHGLEALHSRLKDLDPEAAENIHPNDLRRVVRALEVVTMTGEPISSQQTQFGQQRTDRKITMVGLLWEREELYDRIHQRVDRMLAAGLEEEARKLYEMEPPLSKQARSAVGYAELFDYFAGKHDYNTAIELIQRNTRHLAKSQMTWFRKFDCHWVKMTKGRELPELAEEVLEVWERKLT